MKVAINSQPLASGHQVRGIGFYTKNLITSLRAENVEVQEFNQESKVQWADIIHYPFFDLFKKTLPSSHKFPTVVTVHDVIPLKYPTKYPAGIRGKINNIFQIRSLKKVSAIITDSKASLEDINKYLKVPKEKIETIYLGVDNKFRQIEDSKLLNPVLQQYRLPAKFALYVGNVNWNKNILNMTQACLDAQIDLVIVGKSFTERNNLNHSELKSFRLFLEKYSNNPNINILGFVPDEDLILLYNLATLTILVSFDEGFGLPILESQACGTPVITSNCSSMPEVAGEGAILVDPNNNQEITQRIVGILSDQKLSNRLVELGLDNAKKFSWESTAGKTIKVYQKILSR